MTRALVRDLWRTVLVVVGGSLLIEVHGLVKQRPLVATPTVATPTVATYGGYPPHPAWQQPQPQVIIQQPPPERPLRRVAEAVINLGDSVIGVVR